MAKIKIKNILMCLYPKLIKNPKYKSTKKNGGNIPPVNDERVKYVPIGCQQCMECKKQKAMNWRTRLLEDIKTHKNGIFTTLTYSNESTKKLYNYIKKKHEKNNTTTPTGYELDNEIATISVRLFLERYRKENKKSLRHWFVTELGQNNTEHLHLHGIIWTDKPEQINKHWQYGYIWAGNLKNGKRINYVNEKTINYITKYVNKTDQKHPGYNSIILTSSGIGHNYTKIKYGDWERNKFNGTETNETYRTRTGHKIALPIYYRNKIYTEEEREKLWLQKLDKEERWVLGNKISIKNGDETEYNKALKYAQKINKEMGYNGNERTWEQEQYERERRILKQKERTYNNKKTK